MRAKQKATGCEYPVVESMIKMISSRIFPRHRAFLRPFIAITLALLLCALYWAQLLRYQASELEDNKYQTRLRAVQMSAAMVTQVSSSIASLEYLAHTLATKFVTDRAPDFPRSVETALKTFPRDSILQIAVADVSGNLVYSSLSDPQGAAPKVSIADREHFQVHTHGGPAKLFISRPIMGRVSGKWSLQFSYPVERAGQFAGVLVLSISPDYISNYFREVFSGGSDVAFVVRNDGSYLARSVMQDKAMTQWVSPEREFVRMPQKNQGEYHVKAKVDGVERYYAWNRLKNYPLVVSVGLDSERALENLHEAISDSRWRNALGTLVILAAVLWIVSLFERVRRKQILLQEHMRRFEMALEGGAFGVWDWDLSNDHMNIDTRIHFILGITPDDLEQSIEGIRRLIHPDDWPAVYAELEQVRHGKTDNFENEHRMLRSDGGWCWISARGRVILYDEDGRARKVFGIFTDISARREVEAARRELEQRLTKLVAQVPGVVYQYRQRPDGSGYFPYASPHIVDIYDTTPEEAAKDIAFLLEHVHPQDQPQLRASIDESARALTPWFNEYRFVRDNGEIRWLAGCSNPEREADGNTLWHGYIQDVTKQHAEHEALQQREERLRLTVLAVQDGLWNWDLGSGQIQLDARCYEMLGYPAHDDTIQFDDWSQWLHPHDRMSVLQQLQAQIERSEPFHVETRLLTSQGDWCWVEIRGQITQELNGKGQQVIGTQTDISQRMADTTLRRALLDNEAAALFVTTPQRIIRLANQRAIDTFSEDGLALTGRSIRIIHPDDDSFDTFGGYYRTVRQDGGINIDYQQFIVGGELRWFAVRGSLLDPDNPEGDLIWTMVDTTERRRIEDALRSTRAHLFEVIQHFPGGVLAQNQNGDVVVANRVICDLLGVQTPPVALTGINREAFRKMISQDILDTFQESVEDGEYSLPDGRTIRINLIPLKNGEDNIGRLMIVSDVTERRRHEQNLEYLATTDALTGLANRRAFMARLQAELTLIAQGGKGGMLIMLDLDHFKHVNDSFGHAAGDAVLVYLAGLLHGNTMRKDDLAGRLGGEEFAVLLPNTSAEDGMMVTERLRLALEDSMIDSGEGHCIRITLSGGIAPLNGSPESILAEADAALYRAKNGGRNRIVKAQK